MAEIKWKCWDFLRLFFSYKQERIKEKIWNMSKELTEKNGKNVGTVVYF